MQLSKLSLIALALAATPVVSQAGTFLGIGINVGSPEIITESPPAPLYENVGAPPGPNYAWISGHWAWHHHRWEWVGGFWQARPAAGQVWIAGHWDRHGNGYVWVEGQWVVQNAPPAYVENGPPAPPTVYASAEVVAEAPPAPIYETVPVAPGPEFVWIGGHWGWRGGRWVWTHGRYERHPHWHPGAGWVEGHWDHRDRGYVWVEGRWR